MFGSRIVNKLLYGLLSGEASITGVVGNSIYPLAGAPQDAAYPVLLFYQESNSYDDPPVATRSEHISGQVFRFVVRLTDEGSSDEAILAAAEAQLGMLAGQIFDLDDGNQVTFVAAGEYPVNSSISGSRIYRHLGTVYSVTITSGG